MIKRLGTGLLLLVIALPVRAVTTSVSSSSSTAKQADKHAVGQVTVWDALMAEQAVHQLQAGAEAFSRGDYVLATKHFARAVTSNPDDPRTHLMLGVAQYWSGQVEEAMAAYREVLKIDPKSAHAHQLLGIAYAYKGDMENALKEFQSAAEIDPERPDIQMDLGSVYETMGDRSKALDCFRRAVSIDPKFPLYQFQLGVLYDKLGRDGDAQDSLKEAIHLYPEFQDAILQLGSLRQRNGDLSGAADMFKKAVKLKPGDSVARLRYGFIHLLQGNPDKVSADLDKAFALTPEAEGGKLALSQAYGGSSQAEESGPLGMFRRNMERIPPKQEAKVQVTITRVSSKPATLEAPKEGTSTLKNALGRAFSGPTATHTVREFTLAPASPEVRRTQIEQVINDLRKSAAPGANESEVHLGMNISYPKHDLDAEPEVHPVSYEPRRVGNDLGLWVQGSGWVELVEEVVPLLEDRLNEHPRDVQAKVLLGLAYLTLGDGPKARSSFESALADDAQQFDAVLGLGAAHVINGQDAQALETYKRALALRPSDKTAKDAVKWLSTPVSTPAPAAAPKPPSK